MKKLLIGLLAGFLLVGIAGLANASVINFNDYIATAVIGQPDDPSNQGYTGTYDITSSTDGNVGARLKLHGDIWLGMGIPFSVDADTVLHIEVRDRAPQSSEILGIMFVKDYTNPVLDATLAFSFSGSQNWGIQAFRTTTEDWESFDIKLGDYIPKYDYEGIYFILDDDTAPVDPEGRFQNVSVPEPATLLLLGFGLFGLACFRRKE